LPSEKSTWGSLCFSIHGRQYKTNLYSTSSVRNTSVVRTSSVRNTSTIRRSSVRNTNAVRRGSEEIPVRQERV
jgi:hypothetical protein